MASQRKRIEKALRGCAEAGVPGTVDLWPVINERVTGRRASEARTSEEPAGDTVRRHARPPRLVPGTLLGYVLAAFSVLILGAGAYAVSGPVRELIGNGLSGPGAPHSGEGTNLGQADGGSGTAYSLFRSHVPAGGGEEIGQTQTAGGARVTLGWAYADAGSVVVSYTVEDLEGKRRVGGHLAELQPSYPNGVRLTDESGTEYGLASGGGAVSAGPNNILKGPKANSAIFEAEGRIEPVGEHRFRLDISLLEVPVTPLGRGGEAPEPEPVGEPFAFGFKIPVRPVPVFEVNQKATASGITLTLERVKDSPGRPEAVVCLETTDGVRGWFPVGRDLSFEAPSPVAGEDDCLQMLLNHSLDGRSSVTVEQIEFNPVNDGEVTRGPWRFDFEVPDT